MAVSSHPENFFQTSSSIAESQRKQRKAHNNQGEPIKLPTKLLAIDVNLGFDQSGDVVFVAEAGGSISTVRLSTGEIVRTGKGSQAPVTCLAYHHPGSIGDQKKQLEVYAGGWDRSITRLHFEQTPPSVPVLTAQTNFQAHNDFIKCLLITRTADNEPILISGGADGEINFWSLATPSEDNQVAPGTKLATVKPQARGIECLALDPFSNPTSPVLFFSTSQREISSVLIPTLSAISSGSLQSTLSQPLQVHETSVYKLHFDSAGDIWTASADKTAKHLSREHTWQPDTTLRHPDFVRDVVTHGSLPYVVTACRDEEIRVWNATTGDLRHVFSGHYEEITGLAITNDLLLSVSIDATLRRWSLAPQDLEAAIERARNPQLLEEHPEPGVSDLGLTAEEEAELKAMMDQEEEETLQRMAMDEQ